MKHTFKNSRKVDQKHVEEDAAGRGLKSRRRRSLLFKKAKRRASITGNPRFLGVSVHWIQNGFRQEVVDAGFTAKSTIYDMENLKDSEGRLGPIRRKGELVHCPISKKRGAAYVHCLDGIDNVGTATHMLSYTWGDRIGDIADTLVDFCTSHQLNPKRTYFWICCLCNNQFRMAESLKFEKCVPTETLLDQFKSHVVQIGCLVCMMTKWDKPAYLTRAWCIFEMYTAITSLDRGQVHIVMPPRETQGMVNALLKNGGGIMESLFCFLATTSVTKAEASHEEDRSTILDILRDGTDGYETINREVRHFYDSGLDRILMGQRRTLLKHTNLAKRFKNLRKIAGVRIEIGDLLVKYGRLNAARTMYNRALNAQLIAKADDEILASTYKSIANTFRLEGKNESAFAFESKASKGLEGKRSFSWHRKDKPSVAWRKNKAEQSSSLRQASSGARRRKSNEENSKCKSIRKGKKQQQRGGNAILLAVASSGSFSEFKY